MRGVLLLSLACVLVVRDGQATDDCDRGAWRVTVGPSVIGGVRTRMGVNAGRMVQMSGFGTSVLQPTASGRSKADAYAQGSGEANGGRRVFDGGAYYDPADSASANDGGYSWNLLLHDPQGLDPDGRKGFIERTAYDEVHETSALTLADDGFRGDSTDWLPGLRVEASRELYCSGGEHPWGVDVVVAFAYYFQRDVWKTSGTAAAASAEGSRTEGYYEWWNDSNDEAQYILDYYRDSQFNGSMWGSGGYDAPGMELAADAWRFRDVVTRSESWSRSARLDYDAKGSYREYSIEILVRPWWEPWEWLRLFGSLGVEISRREFEWSMMAYGTDGTVCRDHGKASDWRAVGLVGGGLCLNWRSFFLMGEALWRFAGDDLEVSGRTLRGSVGHGDWGLRASVGYVF